MSDPLTLMIILGAVVLVSALTWRLLTKLYHLPCPPGFIFLLESSLMERAAGPEAIIQRAGIQPGMSVLDAGCGPGRMSIPLARYLGPTGKVVAFDIQEGMLRRLARRLPDSGLENIELVQGALGEGLLGTERYDRALLITVLGEIPNQEAALREIKGALVAGGILSVTEVLPDPHYLRLGRVRQLAERVGFRTELADQGWRSYTLNLIKPA